MTKIGIVLCNYKMKKLWVQQAILSVVAQSMPDWHIYLIGIEGEDITEQIEKESKPEKRISVHYLKEPNVYEQRNYGLKLAVQDCKYVTFMDSDDYFLPCKLMVELYRAEIEYFDIMYTGYYYTDPELVIFRYSGTPQVASKMGMLGGCVIPDYALVSAKFMRDNLYVKHDDWDGYLDWPTYATGCVYDMWLRAIERDARIGAHAAPTWLYRQRPGSLGKQLGNKELIDRKLAIDAAKSRWGVNIPTNIEVRKLWEAGEHAKYQ